MQDELQGQIQVSSANCDHKMLTPAFQKIPTCDAFIGLFQDVESQIQQKKVELEESKIFKQHQEEYEQIKKMITKYPKRSETRAAILKVKAEIASLQQEGHRLDQTIEVCCMNCCTGCRQKAPTIPCACMQYVQTGCHLQHASQSIHAC
jgi:hypothetical protein